MKKILFAFSALLIICACNSNKKPERETTDLTPLERLKHEIDDIHIEGMSKMAELTKLEQRTKKILDSLSTLPDKEPITSMKKGFESLAAELKQAEEGMDNWMNDFYSKPDTLDDDESEKKKYLEDQKSVARQIRDAITNGIRKADTLISRTFRKD